MANGGKRPGAGRPKGRASAKTLEKMAVAEAFNQRVMSHATDLFNAQYKLAVGAQRVFRIDEIPGKKGDVRREHVLVTDPEEIKALLDANEGDDGVVNDNYYYFQTVMPDVRAIDSMLNRTFGKPKESVEVTNPQNTEKALQSFNLWKEKNPNADTGAVQDAINTFAKGLNVDATELAVKAGVEIQSFEGVQ